MTLLWLTLSCLPFLENEYDEGYEYDEENYDDYDGKYRNNNTFKISLVTLKEREILLLLIYVIIIINMIASFNW